ncbi:Sirohem biosynthesis protein C-terminal-domain-containing protein [Epithele typhae]|uniref:Sirohem biosynthesis protein C-terminal-domain-containing protein n=1 Tax=Epithele typhae TaxID=378194 RepID=UPI002008A37B|nr:Sirohem biosynthesis protein C-terminal-domain-containing protein [Epithele typhae]KAH9946336.1 Sirohem biosynthesis protein C-terminal-domain-containing protein [Epithele typhae]
MPQTSRPSQADLSSSPGNSPPNASSLSAAATSPPAASSLHPLTAHFVDNCPRITYYDRTFAGPQDLDNVDMVLTAIDDVDVSRQICALCRERKIPVNRPPPDHDLHERPQPKLANIIRKKIEASIPEHAGEAIERVGELRAKLKERAPGVGGDVSKRRMRWMIDVCSSWGMDELAMLDDQMIGRLLDEGWEKHKVPKLEEVGGARKTVSVPSPSLFFQPHSVSLQA